MTQKKFETLPLNQALLNNLALLKYELMTPIQAESLPLILNGQDLIAQAKTGSGKTAAFGLGILNRLNLKFFGAQALVICPTRELAEQVSQSIRQLARQMPNVKIINLSGGMPMKAQLDSLKYGAHIIVGTPGRILKHLDKATLDISQLSTLVLDEADRMLDMGFSDALTGIINRTPARRQTLMFSATFPDAIKNLAKQYLTKPSTIMIESAVEDNAIEELFYKAASSEKLNLLTSLIAHHQPSSVLIFCNTKQMTTEINSHLKANGYTVKCLNGDMEQVDRDLAMIQFTNLSCPILVATDVAARGLDIHALPLVINYELAFDMETHTHRIGRTGRAGQKGLAISLVSPNQMHLLPHEHVTWSHADKQSPTEMSSKIPTMLTLNLDLGKKDKLTHNTTTTTKRYRSPNKSLIL
jgi:ATP-independent RNA helicase DbpA